MTRILVVDDDRLTRHTLVDTLRYDGYEVETAEDGATALERLRSAPPALVVLDLMMPNMDGWAFLRERAEALTAPVPVLVVSAARGDGLQAAKALGAAFLAKPFDADVFLSMVARLAGRPEPEEEKARLEGAHLAAETMQHHLGNDLSLTVGYGELLAGDPRLPEDLRWQAEQAALGARKASEKLKQLRDLDQYEVDQTTFSTHLKLEKPRPEENGTSG